MNGKQSKQDGLILWNFSSDTIDIYPRRQCPLADEIARNYIPQSTAADSEYRALLIKGFLPLDAMNAVLNDHTHYIREASK